MREQIKNDANRDYYAKPNLVIVASARARSEPSSSLLRLVRDYSDTLKRFAIHTTSKTGRIIYGTGMYRSEEVVPHRSGRDGGVAELAALVARGECVAAILLLDPGDPWSDAVENRALKRVCIQRQVRLITTYAAAVRWAAYEAVLSFESKVPPSVSRLVWKPSNWRQGNRNVADQGDFQQLPVSGRSIALISHDKKKLEMVQFVNTDRNLQLLARHDRILTTGTTGWLLKLLFASESQHQDFKNEIKDAGKETRLSGICHNLLQEDLKVVAPKFGGLEELLNELRTKLKVSANPEFASKVMPLPSGPDGGDVLIANEVLNNECHSMIFFHDPETAHPHNDDIRLLEHTCQVPGVFAECVSDRQSAEKWVDGLHKELTGEHDHPSLAQELRQVWNLQEVVLVQTDNDRDCDELGQAIARACAGYVNQRLRRISQQKKSMRVGLACGWGTKHVLEQLINMEREGFIEREPALQSTAVWAPLIGFITAEVTDWEATTIARGFCRFYGGKVEAFACAGFAREVATMPEVTDLIAALESADIIITSASPWDAEASLYKNTGLDRDCFPGFSDAAGVLSGNFLNDMGQEVKGQYSIVGLDCRGFHEAAKKGAVVLMCAGEERRRVLLAVLRARLVSVLITSTKTAEWILRQTDAAAT